MGRNIYGRFAPHPWGETSMGESPWGEMPSAGRNVHGVKRPWSEMSTHGAKRPWGELSMGQKLYKPT